MGYALDLVSQQFTDLKTYADTTYDAAVSAVSSLNNALGDTAIDTTRPDLDAIETAQSFDVDPLILETINDIEDKVDSLTDDIPEPGSAPTVAQYNLPTEPSIEWPTVPTLSDISIPDFQEDTIRSLESVLPTIDFDVPDLENEIRTALSSAVTAPALSDLGLAEAVHNKLKSNIEDGGTMIDSSVEDDIWNRDLERHEQTLQDIVDKATSQWAKLGFSLPDGLLASNLLAINNEYANKRLDRSREIAVKQAELEQQGMFKSLELGTGFSNMWFGVLEAYKKRAFDLTKITVDTMLAIYKERVNQFNLKLESFKADLLAWKTGIEREMLRAEVYKARIAGLQLVVSIDESKVKIYQSRIAAVSELVKVWDTQIRAVATMYDVEKTKLEAYKTEVEAYATRIDSATKKYAASMEGVKAIIQGWAASADAKVKLIEIKAKADMFEGDAELKQWEIELKTKEQELALRLEGLRAVAQLTSNIAAGALSAVHASAQAGYSTQMSYSYQE